jgi:hypothetical protein
MMNRMTGLSAASKSSSIKELKLHSLTIPANCLELLLSIKTISFCYLAIPADSLERLLCRTQTLIRFKMKWSSIEESSAVSKDQAPAAFSQNKSIEDLILCGMEKSILIPSLCHLGSHTNIKRLEIDSKSYPHVMTMSVLLSKSMQQLLTESSTLQTLKFRQYDFQASTFDLISTGIESSHSLQTIILIDAALTKNVHNHSKTCSSIKS